MALSTLINCHKAIAKILIVVGLRVVMSSSTLSLAVTVNNLSIVALGELRSGSKSLNPDAHLRTGCRHVEFDKIKTCRTRTILISDLIRSATACLDKFRPVVDGSLSLVLMYGVEVVVSATLGIVEHVFIEIVETVAVIEAHISLQRIFGELAFPPDAGISLKAMLLREIVLEPIAGIALPLMQEATMMVFQPHLHIGILGKGFLRIVLEALPLCTLLPVRTTALAVLAIAITEPDIGSIVGFLALAIEDLIGRNLVLKAMTNLMANSRAHRLARTWVHP